MLKLAGMTLNINDSPSDQETEPHHDVMAYCWNVCSGPHHREWQPKIQQRATATLRVSRAQSRATLERRKLWSETNKKGCRGRSVKRRLWWHVDFLTDFEERRWPTGWAEREGGDPLPSGAAGCLERDDSRWSCHQNAWHHLLCWLLICTHCSAESLTLLVVRKFFQLICNCFFLFFLLNFECAIFWC